MKDQALAYHLAGHRVIPYWMGGNGATIFPKDYAKYRETQTEADVIRLFSGRTPHGVALLCVDGLEVIDIDTKHDPSGTIWEEYSEYASLGYHAGDAMQDAVIQRTKSGGYHIIYYTDVHEGNQKLAHKAGREAVIETRGKGGLVFVAPSPGYEVIQGNLAFIPRISTESRNELIKFAKDLDCPPIDDLKKKMPAPAANGQRPGDDYNNRHSALEVAQRYGWKEVNRSGDYIRMNRPGAKNPNGIDGTYIAEIDCLYPFTTSEPLQPHQCHDAFSLYAHYDHAGDFKAAARHLGQEGYGEQRPPEALPSTQVDKGALADKLAAVVFDYNAPIKEEEVVFRNLNSGYRDKIGGFGQLGVITGEEKSGKSFVGSCIGAAALGGASVLDFELDLKGRRALWIDTEQSFFFFQKTQHRIHNLAGIHKNTDKYQALYLRRFSIDERVEAIEHLIYTTPDLGFVMVDGIVDLLKDYNSLEESQVLVNRMMRWTDEKNLLLIGVLHVNKGDKKIRGHIGSEIKNKCEFIIHVSKQEDQFMVSNPTCRYKGFNSYSFTRDQEGNPVFDSGAPVVANVNIPF